MGACLCKDGTNDDGPVEGQNWQSQSGVMVCRDSSIEEYTDQLIRNVLQLIGSIVDDEDDPPMDLVELTRISDTENGLLIIINSLVRTIPMDNPLSALVIAVLFGECALPSRQSIAKIPAEFNLGAQRALSPNLDIYKECNLLIVLGCIAEKMAGPGSVALLTKGTLNYILTFLENENAHLVLFSLIALEKFASTTENKSTILAALNAKAEHPILKLMTYLNHSNYIWRQVGFCAQWCLDNLFLIKGREYSYLSVDLTNINVMLNANDVSQHLKISPDGLEARCDAHSFESVRCTFPIQEGVWYYEATIVTSGVMQIGVATKQSQYLNFEGYGIGDDSSSIAYDGCRNLIWYNAYSTPQMRESWKAGDVFGCLIDFDKYEVIFSINGERLDPCHRDFLKSKRDFYVAASFMSFQQCRFNFGSEEFMYPPTDRVYKNFNDYADTDPNEIVILPRHIYLEEVRKQEALEDSCSICFDSLDLVVVEPCHHTGFCGRCISLINFCPLCRASITYTRTEINNVEEENL